MRESLKDVPGESVHITCELCGMCERLSLTDLLSKMSPDLGLTILAVSKTKDCPHRQPYSGLPECQATSPQIEMIRTLQTQRDMIETSRIRLLSERRDLEEDRQQYRNHIAQAHVHEDGTGWMAHEQMPTNAKPQFRWQPSWKDDRKDDIIGFHGKTPIGRVFQISTMSTNKDVWFWILYGVEARKRIRPRHGSGWEFSQLRAACRVEWCYNHMLAEENQPYNKGRR